MRWVVIPLLVSSVLLTVLPVRAQDSGVPSGFDAGVAGTDDIQSATAASDPERSVAASPRPVAPPAEFTSPTAPAPPETPAAETAPGALTAAFDAGLSGPASRQDTEANAEDAPPMSVADEDEQSVEASEAADAPSQAESGTPLAEERREPSTPGNGTEPMDWALPPVPSLEWLRPILPFGTIPTTGLLILILVAVMGIAVARRVRDTLPERGLLPRMLDFAQVALQAAVLAFLATVVAREIEKGLGPALAWLLIGVAFALGWSVREVVPDFLAGLMLAFERRIRDDVWVSVAGYSGFVERRGVTTVWLRDSEGHRVAIPNRTFLSSPVVAHDKAGPIHEVSLRVDGSWQAKQARQALHDAILTSPWVQPEATPHIRRDGSDPCLWHVRARLLDMRFAMDFEGDLLERTEDTLAASHARIDDDWD